MKLIIILAAVIVVKTDRLNQAYLPPRKTAGFKFLQTPSHISSGTHHHDVNAYFGTPINVLDTSLERPQAARERNAGILRRDQSINGDTYSYVYKTENGIYAEEKGIATNGVQAQGGYSYTGDDGKIYSIRYTADENGFVAQGAHIPTPPPIPKEILLALEQNARDEAAGIFDDGSYDEAKYSGHKQQQYYSTSAQPHTRNYNRHSGVVQKAYLPPRTRRNNQRNQYNRLNQIYRYTF